MEKHSRMHNIKERVKTESGEVRGVEDEFLRLPGLHYKWSRAGVFSQ